MRAHLQDLHHFAGVGVAPEFLFREHDLVVDGHVEDAAATRDDLERAQLMFEPIQNLGRQTDGSVRIPSNGAVRDADLHVSPSRCRSMLAVEMSAGIGVTDRTPPDQLTGDGGGGGWAWLVTARGIIEATLIQGVLEAAGIVQVVLDDRDPSPGAWMYMSGNVNRLVRVFVPISVLERARLELLESGLGGTETPEPVAARPLGERWQRRTLWVVAALLLLAFGIATLAGAVR